MHFLEPFHPTRLLAPLLCRGCPLHAAAEHLQAGWNLKRIWLRCAAQTVLIPNQICPDLHPDHSYAYIQKLICNLRWFTIGFQPPEMKSITGQWWIFSFNSDIRYLKIVICILQRRCELRRHSTDLCSTRATLQICICTGQGWTGWSFSKFAFEKRQSSVEYCICLVDFGSLACSILFWVNQFLLALSIHCFCNSDFGFVV